MKSKKQGCTKQKKGANVSHTCVCNSEWRGTHENQWGDCVCYRDETVKAVK